MGLELAEKAVEMGVTLSRSPALREEAIDLLRAGSANVGSLVPEVEALTKEIARLLNRPDMGKTIGQGAERLGQVVTSGIPHLRDGFLPPDVHLTNWADLTERFAADPNRARFLPGMQHALLDLREGGVNRAYVGGSFVTDKVIPGDFDIAYQDAANFAKSPALKRIFAHRDIMKMTYGGELQHDALDYFKHARDGRRIGVLALDLKDLPARSDQSPAVAAWEQIRRVRGRTPAWADLMRKVDESNKPFDIYAFQSIPLQ